MASAARNRFGFSEFLSIIATSLELRAFSSFRSGQLDCFYKNLTMNSEASSSRDRNKPPWPHAPLHKLSARGTYFVTAGTYLKDHFFRSAYRLRVLHRGLLTVITTLVGSLRHGQFSRIIIILWVIRQRMKLTQKAFQSCSDRYMRKPPSGSTDVTLSQGVRSGTTSGRRE